MERRVGPHSIWSPRLKSTQGKWACSLVKRHGVFTIQAPGLNSQEQRVHMCQVCGAAGELRLCLSCLQLLSVSVVVCSLEAS